MRLNLLLEAASYAALTAAGLAAAGLLFLYPLDITPIRSPDDAPKLPAVQEAADSFLSLSPTRITAIAARPLFSRSRRPFQAEVASPPPVTLDAPTPPDLPDAQDQLAAEASVETLVLKGVSVSLQSARAFIASNANPAGVWLSRGGEIEGWKLDHIAPERVQLKQGDRTAELKLYQRGRNELIKLPQPNIEAAE